MDSRDPTQARRLLQVDSPSVQSHLTMLQSVVNRLAANSAACKTWCVSLVSALAVVAAQAGKVQLLFAAALRRADWRVPSPLLLVSALCRESTTHIQGAWVGD